MPGRVFLTSSLQEIAAALRLNLVSTGFEVTERLNIGPGEQVLALNALGFAQMRWGIIPVGRVNARGRPVMETIINARSETVFDKSAFEGVGRAVMPVNGWYEWTGATRRKTVWRIAPKDGGLLFFAAITDVWRAPNDTLVQQLATVTCPPNADVEPIHHRMAVILHPSDVEAWLNGTEAEAEPLMKPWPVGRLEISEVSPSVVS